MLKIDRTVLILLAGFVFVGLFCLGIPLAIGAAGDIFAWSSNIQLWGSVALIIVLSVGLVALVGWILSRLRRSNDDESPNPKRKHR